MLELVDKGMAVLDLDEEFDAEAHHRLAREAAAESIVLLKNDDGVLPLSPTSRLAVIGEFARTPRYQGAGSSQVNPLRLENVLDELSATFDTVTFAAGYGIGDTSADEALRAEASATAAADTVVMLIGLPAADESEGFDRTHMNLPANQIATLHEVAAANPNLVVVLVNGSTVLLGDVTPHAKALVEAWPGVEDVRAAAARIAGHAIHHVRGVGPGRGDLRVGRRRQPGRRGRRHGHEHRGGAGEFVIEVGHHSRDLPLTHTVTADSTLHEWMADPVGRRLLAEAAAAGQPDPTGDEESVAVIGTMPMSTLAAFNGMSVDHDTLAELVQRWEKSETPA